MDKKQYKKILSVAFFLAVMVLTFYAVFHEQNMAEVGAALLQLSPLWLLFALISALLYTSSEGFMIWYMTQNGNRSRKSLFRCIGYAFIGFFYSGITPSASGGQPMQLYYLKRDGYSFSRSCATLTVIAALNKFVLASIGVGLLLVWYGPLSREFGDYMGWYYLGIVMVVFWVIVLACLMFLPGQIEKLSIAFTGWLERIHVLKPSNTRNQSIIHFFDGYRDILQLLKDDKEKTAALVVISYLQRMFLVLIPYFVSRGFGLHEKGIFYTMLLQVAAMAAVDMLPIPGAQGISELLYFQVFSSIFGATYLTAAVCVTRFVNFYFLLLIGIVVVIGKEINKRKERRKDTSA